MKQNKLVKHKRKNQGVRLSDFEWEAFPSPFRKMKDIVQGFITFRLDYAFIFVYLYFSVEHELI